MIISSSSSFFLSILCKYWYNVNISKYSSFKIVVTYWERLAWMMDEWMDGWFSTPLCLYARSLQRYCRLLDEVPKATEFRGWVDALFVHYVVFFITGLFVVFFLSKILSQHFKDAAKQNVLVTKRLFRSVFISGSCGILCMWLFLYDLCLHFGAYLSFMYKEQNIVFIGF